MRDIGKNIRKLRTRKNMTQDELAEKIFVTRQTVSNYENGKSRPDVDMLVSIAQVLETDIQQLIYGPEQKKMNPDVKKLIFGTVLTAVFGMLWGLLESLENQLYFADSGFDWLMLELFIIQPVCLALLGWTGMQIIGMVLGKQPLKNKWVRRLGWILLLAALIWFGLNLWYICASAVNTWQYHNHIRGQWNENHTAWSRLPVAVPEFVTRVVGYSVDQQIRWRKPKYLAKVAAAGVIIWLCGVPESRRKE